VVDLDTVMELKKNIKKLDREKERAEGRLEQLLKTLKEEFGCSNLEEAEELLEQTKDTTDKLEKKYNTRLETFMDKWGDKLNMGAEVYEDE